MSGTEMLCNRTSGQNGDGPVEILFDATARVIKDTPHGLAEIVRPTRVTPPPSIVIKAVDFSAGWGTVERAQGPNAVHGEVITNSWPWATKPNEAEWRFDARREGRYTLAVELASAGGRPVDILINDQLWRSGALNLSTGGWTPDFQTWVTVGDVTLKKGANTVHFKSAPREFPHFRTIRFNWAADQGS